MSAETFHRLREVVAGTLARAVDSISESTPLAELRLTSLDVVEIASDIEDVFGVSVPEEELRAATTVGDIAKAIDTLRSQGT